MSHQRPRSLAVVISGTVLLGLFGCGAATAQDRLPGKSAHRQHATFAATPRAPRGLTIQKRLVPPIPDRGYFEPELVGQDPNDGYDAIAAFNPASAVTSGYQLPFGLDGIGGYGSDLGFGAGQDASIYLR